MPYKVTAYFRGMPKARSELRAINRYIVRSARKEMTIGGYNAAGEVFEQNFLTEGKAGGIGGWRALAESTQDDRERLGFGREHPILVRYGDLRYATSTFLATAKSSTVFVSTDKQGIDIGGTLRIGHNGGVALAFGDKAENQATRQFWMTTQPVRRAVRKRAVEVLDKGVEGLF